MIHNSNVKKLVDDIFDQINRLESEREHPPFIVIMSYVAWSWLVNELFVEKRHWFNDTGSELELTVIGHKVLRSHDIGEWEVLVMKSKQS